MTAPVLFLGHGNPMNALGRTPYGGAWRAIAQSFAKPRGILAVSAHWETNGSFVTAGGAPKTIHDFGNFGPELYAVQYRAPGDESLSNRVAEVTGARKTSEWGLDHGTWSLLVNMYPDADVPVVQLSIDAHAPTTSRPANACSRYATRAFSS